MVFHFNSSIVLNILSHNGEGDFSTGLGIEIRSPPPSLPKIKLNSKVVQRLNEMILIWLESISKSQLIAANMLVITWQQIHLNKKKKWGQIMKKIKIENRRMRNGPMRRASFGDFKNWERKGVMHNDDGKNVTMVKIFCRFSLTTADKSIF